jgi:hypothetical protein
MTFNSLYVNITSALKKSSIPFRHFVVSTFNEAFMGTTFSPIDVFDFSKHFYWNELVSIINYELYPVERQIILFRLNLQENKSPHPYSLQQIAQRFNTTHDRIMRLETLIATLLRRRGVPKIRRRKK